MTSCLNVFLSCTILLIFTYGPARAGSEFWHLKSSPHFDIYHQSAWSPTSISLEMERLFGRMRLNVSMFAPWMATEKTKIHIYKDQGSYVGGEFKPPKWSKGVAFSSARTVVTFDQGDMPRLRATIAHELAHLYFEGFFGEHYKYPPQWLNEGLAVFMEDISYGGKSAWSEALEYFPKEKIVPLKRFFELKADKAGGDEDIAYWYLEAFGLVSYLFRPHMRMQFSNFCSALRKGDTLETALWKAYRLKDIAALEKAWRSWLLTRDTSERQGFNTDIAAASFNFKPLEISSFGFRNGLGFKPPPAVK